MRRFDLLVIGSGPAGQKAALQAAKAGKRVGIVERYKLLGGGSTHFGTLPSKSYRESVYRFSMGSSGVLRHEMECIEAPASYEPVMPDMIRLLRRKDRVIRMEARVVREQFERNEIEIIEGTAGFIGPNRMEVTDFDGGKKELEFEYACIATGSRPVAPKLLPVDGKRILDSDSVLSLSRVPKSMCVLGAGIIGCEYASMFSMAGTYVTMVDKRKEILPSVDQEVVEVLLKRFMSLGMGFFLGHEVSAVERGDDDQPLKLTLSSGTPIEAEAVLVAQGRQGNIEGLRLDHLGVKVNERGQILVDPSFRTSLSNIFAVGDVIGFPALASTSFEQGRVAACAMFGLPCNTDLKSLYPFGIYTIPEISMIGESEQELKARGAEYVKGLGPYREVARGQIVGDPWGMVKLLVDRKTRKILGVHIIGDSAAELIHIGQAVMSFGGQVDYFVDRVFNYPTFAEAYKTAAYGALNALS